MQCRRVKITKANASSKDGSEFYQLLINKLTGEVQIINRRQVKG